MKLLGYILTVLISFTSLTGKGQGNLTLGAYYFDGWTGHYPYHITQSLADSFQERQPKWGWITSTPDIMNDQIKAAADAGLTFFSFCWYYRNSERTEEEPLNHALGLYLKSPYKDKMKYCLLVTNHRGFEISPGNWEEVGDEWIKHFQNSTYLKVGGKPLLIFYTSPVKEFGSTQSVSRALQSLRKKAVKKGLAGITIAMCTNPDPKSIKLAEACGFDILTGYNYATAGFTSQKRVPIERLSIGEYKAWSKFAQYSSLKYIPVVTLNWDPRPWANSSNNYRQKPYYVGFSPQSVYNSISRCAKWLSEHPRKATRENLAILYAWNENGEGAYLTPTKDSIQMLDGVKKILRSDKLLNNPDKR